MLPLLYRILCTAGFLAGLLAALAMLTRPFFEVPPVPALENTWWGPGKPGPNKTVFKQFNISVSDEVLNYLQVRLSTVSPLQESLEEAQQHYGIHSGLVKNVLKYWRTEYDWRAREKFLNQYPQYMVNVQGLEIHYLHAIPDRKYARRYQVRPLLLLHGWAETFTNYYDLIPFLITPQQGRDVIFEVVVPSLPGFGYSDAASKKGLGAIQMAVVMKNFMQALGFKKYYMQGNDWGSAISQIAAVLYPEKLYGVHSTMCFSIAPTSLFKLFLYAPYPSFILKEQHEKLVYPLTKTLANALLETGYLHIQATKPDTVGVALHDSPIGLAAYILEKYVTLTKPSLKNYNNGGLISKFNMNRLLDNIMVYWLTGSITTSMRIYAETFNKNHMGMYVDRIPITEVPTGCARFKNDLFFFPDTLLMDKYKTLMHLTDYSTGHFAALEVPYVLAKDIYDFVEKVESRF